MTRPAFRPAIALAIATLAAAFAAVLIQPTASASAAPVRIMPLGDSITGSPGCWRASLWNQLQSNGYTNIDFVGTLPTQGCGVAHDGDNEGHGGILATNMANQSQLPGWLNSTRPDIVLMHLGTNDVWSNRSPATILAAFSTLVDQMRASNPSMKILVAKIIPMNPSGCGECGQRVIDFNAAIPGWAAGKSTAQSPITVVDQWSGFSTAADTYDGVHPNAAGDQKMSAKWYPPLAALLNGATASPSPSSSPSISPSASPSASPSVSSSASPPPSNSPAPGKLCVATYRLTNQWPTGFGAEVVIANTGAVAITGWTVVLTFPNGQTITQLWNGAHSQAGATVTVKNLSYNGDVAPGGSTAFGFNGSWNNSTNNSPAVTCTPA